MQYEFPAVELADEYGILALSKSINVEMMECAYRQGIFPWPQELPIDSDVPLIPWFAPNPRAIFDLQTLKLNRSWKRAIKSNQWGAKINHDFSAIIRGCSDAARRPETWITQEMFGCYEAMLAKGLAYSVGIYLNDKLVGGVFGIRMGHYVTGESMFFEVEGAGKVALGLCLAMLKDQNIMWLDSQVLSPATEQLGATEIPRTEFMQRLGAALNPRNTLEVWQKNHQNLLEDSERLQRFIIDKLS
jgi:leucyl/phenylalanyl-tRNA--protein transferase